MNADRVQASDHELCCTKSGSPTVSVGESGYSYRYCTHLEPMYLLLQPDDGIYISIPGIT